MQEKNISFTKTCYYPKKIYDTTIFIYSFLPSQWSLSIADVCHDDDFLSSATSFSPAPKMSKTLILHESSIHSLVIQIRLRLEGKYFVASHHWEQPSMHIWADKKKFLAKRLIIESFLCSHHSCLLSLHTKSPDTNPQQSLSRHLPSAKIFFSLLVIPTICTSTLLCNMSEHTRHNTVRRWPDGKNMHWLDSRPSHVFEISIPTHEIITGHQSPPIVNRQQLLPKKSMDIPISSNASLLSTRHFWDKQRLWIRISRLSHFVSLCEEFRYWSDKQIALSRHVMKHRRNWSSSAMVPIGTIVSRLHDRQSHFCDGVIVILSFLRFLRLMHWSILLTRVLDLEHLSRCLSGHQFWGSMHEGARSLSHQIPEYCFLIRSTPDWLQEYSR